MKNCYEVLIAFGTHLQSILLLGMRLFWGYLFFQSGLGKFYNIGNVIEFFRELGIPFPEVNAYLAAGVECIGGLLLLVGLATRLVAIPLAFTMVVAMLTAHWNTVAHLFQNPEEFVQQGPFPYLMTCLIVFAFGPGAFSLDALLEKFFYRQSTPSIDQ